MISISFEPSVKSWETTDKPRQKAIFVDQTNNIHFRNYENGEEKQLTEDGSDTILNGVPDWVYEEEMFASKSAIWWTPNGNTIFYLKERIKNPR